jgi:uncharacterized membrane-anchored protein
MNKKQLIVAGAMGILIILSILFPITAIIDYEFSSEFKNYGFVQIAVVLIIGGILLYVLRDKKKNVS